MPFKDSPKKNGEPFFDPALTNSYSDFFTRVKITDAGNEISEVELAPHQKKKLRLEITLSKENNARDYYFSVVFLSKNDLETPKTSSTEIRSGVGTNVLLSVGPKDGTDGTINAFKTKKFINSGPVTFEMEVKNSSNSFIEPEGTIVIENMFGQKVGQVVIAPVNILSYSERESFAVWNEKWLFGKYKTTLSLSLSPQGPVIIKSFTFFAFPLEAFLGIFLAILFLIWTIRQVKTKRSEV